MSLKQELQDLVDDIEKKTGVSWHVGIARKNNKPVAIYVFGTFGSYASTADQKKGIARFRAFAKKHKLPFRIGEMTNPSKKKTTRRPAKKKTTRRPAKKKTTRRPAKKKTTRRPAKKRGQVFATMKKAKKNPSGKIAKRDVTNAARLAVWYAIIKSNKSKELVQELYEMTVNWAGREPTQAEIRIYTQEIQKWLDKIYPPELSEGL